MDIGLTEEFDIELNARNDLPVVSGRELFEQRLRIAVTEVLQDAIGGMDRNTTLQLIRVQAQRVARESEDLDAVGELSVEYDDERPNTINLTVIYDTGETFQTTLSE